MKSKRVYAVCLLDMKYWRNIDQDLSSRGYRHVKAVIPTVSILKKVKAGKTYYEDYPLLFDYGFIKMPSRIAYDRVLLNKMRRDIPGIKCWVRDTFSIHPKKKRKRIDNAEDWDDFSKVSVVSREEIRRLKLISKENNVFNFKDIVSLPIGSYIILKGYPFEGIGAVIENISLSSRTVNVVLYPDTAMIHTCIPFDNLLYSPYSDIEVPDDKVSVHKPVLENNIFTESI